jgi:tubulin--tyrosine ligase-like protein 12
MVESTFQEYETHFTVMNYGGKDMTNVRCAQFMEMFDEEYKDRGITFAELNEKAFKAIKDVFVAFQTRYGKEIMDMGDLDNARACYGVDVMIDQDCNAKLLEVTFAPDMGRFCKFTPNGYNEVFGNLYFNECQNMTRIV